MLVLTRKPDEDLVIRPALGLDPQMTVAELFAGGPLLVRVIGVNGRRVKVGVDAPLTLDVARSELLGTPMAEALEAARRR